MKTTLSTPATTAETTDAPGGGRVRSNRKLTPWLALAVPLIIVLVGAWTYRWVQEDAFIDFRIIDNLLAGHGPVFNVGERVEAYSDPLWLFTLAGLRLLLPFISLEWISVASGLASTAAGVLLGGRAVQRLAESRDGQVALPVGLLIFSVVAGVWEFVTGGLEMGMVFSWIGLTFWLLVRLEERRRSPAWCAFVAGLGSLERPELVLMAGVFLVATAIVIGAPGWKGQTSISRRWISPLVAALILPVLYELWRMAYFALIEPNTGLAKSGTGAWWSQGFTYLWNFVAPYTLWLPFLLALPLVVPRLVRWWRAGDRLGVVVLLTPVVAGMGDLLYVARVGGDYMHARLLLPGFFALCVVFYVEARQLRQLAVVPLTGILIWSVVCGGWLRFDTTRPTNDEHGISNERDVWVATLRFPHPITLAQWSVWAGPGDHYAAVAKAAKAQGRQELIVSPDSYFPLVDEYIQPAQTALPVNVIVNIVDVGSRGFTSGSDVYVYDQASLANPIGAHLASGVLLGGRPGSKPADWVWMVARFGTPAESAGFRPPPGELPVSVASLRTIAAARSALNCGELKSYLTAITARLTISRALSDLSHSLTFTSFRFSPNPVIAQQQLCHRRNTSERAMHGGHHGADG